MNLVEQLERSREEMSIADRIKQSLVPTKLPTCSVVDIAAYLEPSVEVGGDFYDIHEPDENTLVMMIGDVSGKGIPAALHMAEMKGIFKALAPLDLPVAEFIERTNKAVTTCFKLNVFVTLIYLVLKRKERTLTYARAGHCPILHYSHAVGKAEYIKDHGMGLGILRDQRFNDHVHVYERKLYSGDIFVLMTDGFEEAAEMGTNDRYGAMRLLKSLENAKKSTAETIKQSMLKDFSNYVVNARTLDDRGMLVLQVK